MQLYGEYNYFDEVTSRHLAEMFKVCTGYDADAFALFNIDDFGGLCTEHDATVSKQVFYSDPLLGLFDKNLSKLDLKTHYKKLLDKFDGISPQKGLEYLFEYQKQLIKILYEKCTAGTETMRAYKSRDIKALAEIAARLAEIAADVEKLRGMQYEIWNRNNKAFGFEYFDGKLGTVIARLKSSARKIEDYVNGKFDKIEELEEEKLYFSGNENAFVHQYSTRVIQMP